MKNRFLLLLCAGVLIVSLAAVDLSKLNFTSDKVSNADSSCIPKDYTGEIVKSEKTARFEGKTVNLPSLALEEEKMPVLSLATEERWIEVDLSEQKLYAWEGDKLFLETLVSTGLPGTPTPEGEYRIWIKLRATTMEGGEGRYYYYLPNVPYVMYFEGDDLLAGLGYGLHGTYWHSDFGTQKSHGCVNLPTNIAKELYYWTSPNLNNGGSMVKSSEDNPGTRIVIHE